MFLPRFLIKSKSDLLSDADIFVVILIIGAFFGFVKVETEIFVFVESHIDFAVKFTRFLVFDEMIATFARYGFRHLRYLP